MTHVFSARDLTSTVDAALNAESLPQRYPVNATEYHGGRMAERNHPDPKI